MLCSHHRLPTTSDLRFLLVRRLPVRLRLARHRRALPAVAAAVEVGPPLVHQRLRLVRAVTTPRPGRVTPLPLPLLLMLLSLPLVQTQRGGTPARTATRTRIAYRTRLPFLKDSTMAAVGGVERARTTRRAVRSPSGRDRRGANRPIMGVIARGTRRRRRRGIGVRIAGIGIASMSGSAKERGRRSENAETATATVTVVTALRRRGDLRPGAKTTSWTESRTTAATHPGCGSAGLVIGRMSAVRPVVVVITTMRRRRARAM